MSLYDEPLTDFTFDEDGRWLGTVTDWTIWWEGKSYFIKTAMTPIVFYDDTRPCAIEYAKKRTLQYFYGLELAKPFRVHVVPHDDRYVTLLQYVAKATPKGIQKVWLETKM